MASGVTPSQECIDEFHKLKLQHAAKFIIYTFSSDKKQIIVDTTSSDKDYEKFLEALPENETRYAVYDFEYDEGEGVRNKIVFFNWIPDGASTRQKMMSASSKDALKRSLNGIGSEIQGTDLSEISFQIVKEKVARK